MKFIEHYRENGGNATQAVISAGYTEDPKSASVIGSKLIKHPKIKKIIDKTEENLRDRFREEAEKAFITILSLVDNPKVSAKVRLDACKDILDRAGYNPTQKQELIGHVTFEAKAIETAKRARLMAQAVQELPESIMDAELEEEIN
jgi:phage terminase small subunit